jgi:two-component system cell cycle response regulator
MTAPPSVVVADDDVRAAGVIAWLLREKGYSVATAKGNDELQELLRRQPADLVIIGWGADGSVEGVVKLVRSGGGAALPVLVAGVSRSAEAQQAIRAGADDWISKPVRVAELLARIETHLNGDTDARALRTTLQRREEELVRAQTDIATTRQLVEILNEVTAELAAAEIYRVLARRVARALDLRHCSIVLGAPGESMGTVVAAYDDPSITDLQVRIDRYPELQAALDTNRPVLVDDVLVDPMFAEVRELWRREVRTPPIRSVLAIPFALDRRQSGIFFLRTERGDRTLTTEDADFAEVVIRAAVAAIRRAHALESSRADNRRLEELATTDALTRLMNRRALLERLSVEVDRARRFKSQLSLLMLDLDHFKAVNDRYGHLAGDSLLRQIGTLLAGDVRTIDVVARYGGEEFVLILPETSTEGAAVFAERLRERVESERFELEGAADFHLTCSIGVATFPSPRVASTEDLFARADEALYRAKSGGRNQVRT